MRLHIIEDTRQQAGKHELKHEKWEKKNEKSEDRSSIDKKVYYNQSIRGKKR